MFNFNQLYYFFVTARSGGVTSAARELRISQPSLSAQIKTLEGSLNRRLFRKDGRRLRLTQDGELIFGHCRKMFEAAETLDSLLKNGRPEGQRVHLGLSQEVERPLMVEIIGKWLGKRKNAAPLITMTSDNHEVLLQRLNRRELDVVIVNQPTLDPDFHIQAGVKMPVVLAFNPNGQFKKLQKRPPGSIRSMSSDLQLRWALPRRGMRLRKEIDHFAEKHRIDFRPAFESDILATVVRAVIEDVGVAFLPMPYIHKSAERKSIAWISPPDGYWKHGLWLVTKESQDQSHELDGLRETFRSVLRTHEI